MESPKESDATKPKDDPLRLINRPCRVPFAWDCDEFIPMAQKRRSRQIKKQSENN